MRNAQVEAWADFRRAKGLAKSHGIAGERPLYFLRHLDRMRNAWVAHHAMAPWMHDGEEFDLLAASWMTPEHVMDAWRKYAERNFISVEELEGEGE